MSTSISKPRTTRSMTRKEYVQKLTSYPVLYHTLSKSESYRNQDLRKLFAALRLTSTNMRKAVNEATPSNIQRQLGFVRALKRYIDLRTLKKHLNKNQYKNVDKLVTKMKRLDNLYTNNIKSNRRLQRLKIPNFDTRDQLKKKFYTNEDSLLKRTEQTLGPYLSTYFFIPEQYASKPKVIQALFDTILTKNKINDINDFVTYPGDYTSYILDVLTNNRINANNRWTINVRSNNVIPNTFLIPPVKYQN